MPVQALTMVISHYVRTRQRIFHRIELRLLHDAREKFDQRRPFVNPIQRAVTNLVTAERLVGGIMQRKRRVIRSDVIDIISKINIMLACMPVSLVAQRSCPDDVAGNVRDRLTALSSRKYSR